jgi:hypothetical protein
VWAGRFAIKCADRGARYIPYFQNENRVTT